MLIRRTRGWEIPESQVTPENAFLARRRLLGAGAAGIGALALQGQSWFGLGGGGEQKLPDFAAGDPSLPLYPAQRSMRYRVDRDLTEEKNAVSHRGRAVRRLAYLVVHKRIRW